MYGLARTSTSSAPWLSSSKNLPPPALSSLPACTLPRYLRVCFDRKATHFGEPVTGNILSTACVCVCLVCVCVTICVVHSSYIYCCGAAAQRIQAPFTANETEQHTCEKTRTSCFPVQVLCSTGSMNPRDQPHPSRSHLIIYFLGHGPFGRNYCHSREQFPRFLHAPRKISHLADPISHTGVV